MELTKQTLDLRSPVLNAAGMLGFAPDSQTPVDWDRFGAFVSNPISKTPRRPAGGIRWQIFPGGALLHSGHPNPGLSQSLRHHTRAWSRAPVPIIIHLLASAPEDLKTMILRLEELENIIGVEVGFPAAITSKEMEAGLAAALGELPLIARLPLDRAVELGTAAIEAGAAAVSLGPPRGALTNEEGGLIFGRTYGPAVFPQALRAVDELHQLEIPVIGAGGIYHPSQTEAMLGAGAFAVQLDTVLWRGDYFSET